MFSSAIPQPSFSEIPTTSRYNPPAEIGPIFSKNVRSHLASTLEALNKQNFGQARDLLVTLETLSPLTSERIKSIFPHPIDLWNFHQAYNAIERVYISDKLKIWVEKGDEGELRSEASERIQAYLDHPKEPYLNLSGLHLKKLPNIFNAEPFETLKELDLSYNNLTDLPDTFGNLRKLQILWIRSNDLVDLPETFKNLVHLKDVNLSHNKFPHFPNILTTLTELENLILNYNQLTELPSSLGNLKKLKILGLNYNKLQALPDTFGNLSSLIELGLKDNQLFTLPHTFVNLVSLEIVGLRANRFSYFPNVLCGLVNLKALHLGDNEIKHLPYIFRNLINLEVLLLSNNQFKIVPKSLTNLPALKDLDLNNNPFIPDLEPRENWAPWVRTLPPSYSSGTKPVRFLSRNDLNHLVQSRSSQEPAKLEAMTRQLIKEGCFYLTVVLESLKEENLNQAYEFLRIFDSFMEPILDLSNPKKACRIIEKSLTLCKLNAWAERGTQDELRTEAKDLIMDYLEEPETEGLDLRNLCLKSLPNIFNLPEFQNLRVLRIDSNQLTSLPSTFLNLTKLEILVLTENYFSDFPDVLCHLTTLKRLWVDYNELTYLPNTLGHLVALNELRLNNNKISQIPDTIDELTNLEILELSTNKIVKLPETFSNLKKLKTLYLADNYFVHFPYVICNLFNLKSLCLSYNNLNYLPDTFSNLSELKILVLYNNNFTVIPTVLADLPKLEDLRFNDNPLIPALKRRDNWISSLPALIPPSLKRSAAYFYSSPPPSFESLANHPKIIAWLAAFKQEICHDPMNELTARLKARVRYFLEEAEKNIAFRSSFIQVIDGANHHPLFSLVHLKLAKLQLSLDIQNLPKTCEALSKCIVFSILEKFAKQKIDNLKREIDYSIAAHTYVPTEDQIDRGPYAPIIKIERDILLTYPARLAGRFNLPIDVTDMLSGTSPHVTDIDLADAEREVEFVIGNEEHLHKHLLEIPLWEEALKINNTPGYRHITLEVEALLESEDGSILKEAHHIKARNIAHFSLESMARPVLHQFPPLIMPSLQNIARLPLQGYERDILDTIQGLNQFFTIDTTQEIITRYNERKSPDYPMLATSKHLFHNPWKSIDPLLLLEIVTDYLRNPYLAFHTKKENSACVIA